ncbi:MAG: molybdopterin molybdotransferase MoeA [Alphaproteobacteria bacterium]|nr:molybdopterin molybdotransferase MoeA [Alphaproteobacteria bacterium]
MISVEEAVATIRAGLAPLPAEEVALADGLNRVLAEDLAAGHDQPPVAVSAMDGYAVRATDTVSPPTTLALIGESRAGGGFAGRVTAGEAVRIFTGAPLPEGADAIVIQEVTERTDTGVLVKEAAPEGHFVRPAGLDFHAGDVLLAAGTALTPRALGLAAAANRATLAVRRRPVIAILSTGDELVEPGGALQPAQNVNANAATLGAYVRALGGEPVDLGIARDSRESLLALVKGAEKADLLVTSGGASVGDHDLVRSVLGEEGLALDFSGVAARPGKPTFFGRLKGTPLLGLPGNPVSIVVGGLLFLRPALEALLGMDAETETTERAKLAAPLERNGARQAYLRARSARQADGTPTVTPFAQQDSSMLAQAAAADCLVVRAPHAPDAAAGDWVEILRIP